MSLVCHRSHFLGSYNHQDHPSAAKISKQYLLQTKLENRIFWWSWKMATTISCLNAYFRDTMKNAANILFNEQLSVAVFEFSLDATVGNASIKSPNYPHSDYPLDVKYTWRISGPPASVSTPYVNTCSEFPCFNRIYKTI
jgi:hypothetical protein